MNVFSKNSLDLLRLVAAGLVLYGHQHILNGQPEPSFFGWQTFGGAGVSIFFFLSGMLVWSSWTRDTDVGRFFTRRLLRILPALWVVVLATVFLLGPWCTNLSLSAYFMAPETWRYLGTALLAIRHHLPGVFADNPYPSAVNGSLWTLPLEFSCYVMVSLLGCVKAAPAQVRVAGFLLVTVLLASLAPWVLGEHIAIHFEMMAIFWAGAFYAESIRQPRAIDQVSRWTWVLAGTAVLLFALLGPRGFERTAMLVFAGGLVHIALKVPTGAKLTDRLGDLSYGLYIFAFPVQQVLAKWALGAGWGFGASFSASLLVTGSLAFASWHLVEKPLLRFKPRVRGPH